VENLGSPIEPEDTPRVRFTF